MRCVIGMGILAVMSTVASAHEEIRTFVNQRCVQCHTADSAAPLDLTALQTRWDDREVRQHWIRVFDRIRAGEMPPKTEPAIPADQTRAFLQTLQKHLHESSLKQQQDRGRVPFRRLSNTEFRYLLTDLLQIEDNFKVSLPPEAHSETFDTVGSYQRLSHLHLEGYLKTAEAAVNQAIQLGQKHQQQLDFDFRNNVFLQALHELPVAQGGSLTVPHKDGVIVFLDVDYLLRATNFGFFPQASGNYRISATASAWQTDQTLTAKLIRRRPSGATKLIGAVDVEPRKPHRFQFTTWLEPGDDFYLTFEMGTGRNAAVKALLKAEGAKNYEGAGLLIQAQSVIGPLSDSWPSQSTMHVMKEFKPVLQPDGSTELAQARNPKQSFQKLMQRIGEQAFRRPVLPADVDPFYQLATTSWSSDSDPIAAVRTCLPAMLASPDFLIETGPAGPLDDWQLADRLARFLWKGLPDQTLRKLAAEKRLSDPAVLRQQVDRMIDDPKCHRFVDDFVNQWLRVAYVDATSPDAKRFPEFDELLRASIPKEPRLFFAELLGENLPSNHLIDSDFTFVNRRLALHYGFKNIKGQHFRRIQIPPESPRGGILTQAALLKTTANGTVTSPVVRGNFVLTNLLGTPVPPPPPGVESIDPDTKGAVTIKETLMAHRKESTCARCHDRLDPAGFALEEFDAIGGHRTFYSSTAKTPSSAIDTRGVTEDGESFHGIRDYKRLLMKNKSQVAKNLVTQLIVYSTGGEIQFADRKVIDDILNRLEPSGYRVKDMIQEVVQSPLFRNR